MRIGVGRFHLLRSSLTFGAAISPVHSFSVHFAEFHSYVKQQTKFIKYVKVLILRHFPSFLPLAVNSRLLSCYAVCLKGFEAVS